MHFIRPGQTIIVGVSFDLASGVALRRASALAQSFQSKLRVVYSVPWMTRPLVCPESEVLAMVAFWAAEKVRLTIDEADIAVSLEAPAMAIARAARDSRASLVVVGASRPRLTPSVAEKTMQLVDCPVLVAQPPRRRDEVVAATDLRDRRFPVVHAAASLADACSARVTLVHNLEETPAFREQRKKLMWPALRDLFALSAILPAVKRAHLASVDSTVTAIAKIANERAADVVAIGVRPGRDGVIRPLLASTASSVLAIPLSDGR